MKVMLVHNYYGSAAPSGENLAYDCDVELLRQHGHEVIQFTTHSDVLRAQRLLGPLRGALTSIWNPYQVAHLRHLIQSQRPDIMHVHNVFPRLSPATSSCGAAASPSGEAAKSSEISPCLAVMCGPRAGRSRSGARSPHRAPSCVSISRSSRALPGKPLRIRCSSPGSGSSPSPAGWR